jgi:DNA repair exonuclease SbcCD ATPase subunit
MTGKQNELRTTARALYALPPAQFTGARNRAAKELAKGASKNPAARPDAAALKRLPKASATAWAASAVAREAPELFDRLLELGQRLRDAQAALDSAALRTLAAERQRLVAEATERARELSTQAGVAISSSSLVEVSQTLQAAVTDADAAAAVRGGLLVRGLTVSGWEPVSLEGAVALSADGSRTEPSIARPGRGRASGLEPAASAHERKRAEDLAWQAVDDVAVARGRVEELDGELDELASKRAELEAERAEIEEQLRGVESDLSTVYHDIQTATRNRKAAERDEARAARQAKQAKERLDRLG